MASQGEPPNQDPIPVTLLSGFLGAGKTNLLQHILRTNHQQEGEEQMRVAVVVNDMAELNIDAKLVGSVSQTEEKVVEMQNGCICCTLREDLLVELKKLAHEGRFDYIVIESTGISEPQQVAETFAFEDADGVALDAWTRLDTLVTVVDGVNFTRTLESTENVQDTKEAVGDGDDRNISTLLIDQVEFADVILLNKCDKIEPETASKIENLIGKMNPNAKVHRTVRSQVPLSVVTNTGSFDLIEAATTSGWMKMMRGEAVKPETEEYGVSSFVYRQRRPFHPQRLFDLLDNTEPLPGVVRSKGFCWFAHHNDEMFLWSSAGVMYDVIPNEKWFAAKPREEWEVDPRDIEEEFEEPHGDRRQEVVVIGLQMDVDLVTVELDKALMAPGEEFAPAADWKDPWEFDEMFKERDEHNHADHQ